MSGDNPPPVRDYGQPQHHPTLNFPDTSMQNQIHELAKTLPPPRKQNTACDACRTRKVKCQRLPGQDKCQHCLSKNYPCTHYVQAATSEKKRTANLARRPRNLSSASRYDPLIVHGHSNGQSNGFPAPLASSSSSPVTSKLLDGGVPPSPYTPPLSNALTVKHWFSCPITTDSPTQEVLKYLFSPPESQIEVALFPKSRSPYADWGELAYRLEDDHFKAEFALDLVEVFFQIVHSRLPLLNPAQFRLRLGLQDPRPLGSDMNDKPLHPALIATVIAWGSKFSEHSLLMADRKRRGGPSTLSKALIDRARELAENMKVHRKPTPDNVVIALLIEPLQCQTPGDADGYQGFWLNSGIRNMLNLQINHKTVMSSIQEPDARGTMIFAWWMACLSDAFSAVYYRRKPILDDDDYDIDFYTADPMHEVLSDSATPTPSPREQLEFLGYYRAAHALARIARNMARMLWKPATEIDGVPFQDLCSFFSQLSDWRDQYLHLVGVPNNFQAEWDFVSAVSACASDATFHVMWIFLFAALDEFGIKDINDLSRVGSSPSVLPNYAEIEIIKRKAFETALHAALRIAGLAGVLASNGYLRLDTAVMHVSCIQAGMLLARLGRPEVTHCIMGLEQYSHAYEEAGEYALDIKRTYASSAAGESDFSHMVSVIRGDAHVEPVHSMAIDDPDNLHARNSDPGSHPDTIISQYPG